MKDTSKITLLAALLLAPLASFAESTVDVRDVRIVRSTGQEPSASLLGQRSIALWKEKHLVVACQKGIVGKTDRGSIDAIVSGNDGDSWSILSTVFDVFKEFRGGNCNRIMAV